MNFEKEKFPRKLVGTIDCPCDLRTRLVGDGCHICNPEYAKQFEDPDQATESEKEKVAG